MTRRAQTATGLLQAYREGTDRPSDAVRRCLDRIEAEDWRIRAFIHVADNALLAAEAAEARFAVGAARPLEGVPVAIKDNIGVADMPHTDGTALFADRIADRDAFVVRALRDAGAVLVGKLNLHEGALGATTDNARWGRCINPLRDGYTPGGSSGGSAAAIAAGFVPLALGTDTMGSVRIPAAYCGLWGLKPTRGAVGRTGLSLLSWTLDTIGPLASTAADLRLVYEAIAGLDPDDPDGLDLAMASDVPTDRPPRLGVPDFDRDGEEPEVTKAFEAFLARACALRIETSLVTVLGWARGELRRAALLVSEAEGAHLLADPVSRDDPGLSEGFRAALKFGRDAGSDRLAAAYAKLRAMRPAVLSALTGVDALILPTAPQRAFVHGIPAPANQADYTALANAAGLPALAFPIAADGLPVSAQLIGRPGADASLIGMAEALSEGAS